MQTDSFFKRLLPVLAVGLLLVLAACGGGAPADQEAAPDAAESSPATEEAADAETEADAPTEEAASEATEADESTAAEADTAEADESADEAAEAAPDEELLTAPVEPVSCTSVEIPTYEAITPITDNDWALGPEDASLTLIEYGDFQ